MILIAFLEILKYLSRGFRGRKSPKIQTGRLSGRKLCYTVSLLATVWDTLSDDKVQDT